jgi:transposase-like protein
MGRAVSGQALRELCATLGVPRGTLDRWRAWWNHDLLATPFWKAACARFMPPVCEDLPGALLARFTATDPLAQLLQALRFVAPLSTLTEGR